MRLCACVERRTSLSLCLGVSTNVFCESYFVLMAVVWLFEWMSAALYLETAAYDIYHCECYGGVSVYTYL